MSRFVVLAALAFAILQPRVTNADEPRAQSDAELVKTAQSVFKDLRTTTLENGLRVYLLPMKNAPTVSVMVAYRVGSGDEEKDQTGLSHYLEHLMFKGTEKLMPGDIDRITQRNGGQNNAYTSEDMTVYHFDFAANRYLPALEIEADRMRNLRIDEKHEFQEEKGAVISELNGNEDSDPYDLVTKTIIPVLFPKESPYSHPVIGEKSHVQAATAEIIKRHYDKWYHPNNASLVIVGGFDADEALAKVKQLFGSIPRAKLPERRAATFYKDRVGPVIKEIPSKFDVPRMEIGFNAVAVGSPDDPVLDLVMEILTEGKTSRLYKKMVEEDQIASSVNAGNNSGRYPGWFAITVDLFKGKDRKKAEEIVFTQLARLANEPVSDEELQRAKRKMLASRVFGRESVHGLANSIASTSAYPVGEDVAAYFQKYLEAVIAVSKADIQRVAKQYLTPRQAVIVWSIPKDEAKPAEKPAEIKKPGQTPAFRTSPGKGGALAPAAGAGGFSLAATRREVLPNGLTVLMLEDHRLPIVVADVELTDVILREPPDKSGVAVLVGALLDEGTKKQTGNQIAAAIEDTGGSMNFSLSVGSLKVLTPDTDRGLGMLFDCLMNPTFPEESFARHKEQQLAAIEDSQTQANVRGSELFHALVYGKHPYGRPRSGTRATVEKLTRADCEAFHALAYAPNLATVVVVGDFSSAEMLKKIESLTRDWKKAPVAKLDIPQPPKATGVTTKILSDPQSKQLYVYIGELGVTRDNPDYYKLLVMDYVLGTGTGFTDRLSASLRDRQGLAYTVHAAITESAGKQPGMFSGYIGTYPEVYQKVREGFLAEINAIRDKPATKEEVEDAKQYLLASLPFRFTTLSAVASQILTAERYNLGFDFLEKFQKEVAAVTPEDVQAVARKHLDPKTLTIVAAGPIDQAGKSTAPKKE
jgi:zinc protease